MATTLDALEILPLASAIAWWAVGLLAGVRSRVASPFDRAIALAASLIGTWAFVDFLSSVRTTEVLLDLRLSCIAVATLCLLFATKWMARGHSRYDALLVIPMLASLGFIWDGFASMPNAPFGEAFWAVQQFVYLPASLLLWASLDRRRTDLSGAVRRRFLWTVGIPLVVLGVGVALNVVDWVRNDAIGETWLSALLVIPAAVVLRAIVAATRDDWGDMLRAVSAMRERVNAIYMFYRTGEPLVALASNRNLPIEAEQLEAILSVVGNFVETSVPSSRGYAVTAMRYEGLGLVAVRGEFVIVAAVYDGPAYDALRSELMRTVKEFEERSRRDLRTWEDATRVAETAANELSNLLHRPERTAPPPLPPSAPKAKPGKTS